MNGARILRLESAALFAFTDHGFERGVSVGWTGALLTRFLLCAGSPEDYQRRRLRQELRASKRGATPIT